MIAYYIADTKNGPVAQWIEQLPSKQLVAGSIPARAAIFFALMPENALYFRAAVSKSFVYFEFSKDEIVIARIDSVFFIINDM